MKRTLFHTILLLLLFCNALYAKGPKNVIIMIGDGMSYNQIQAASTLNGNYMNMERCTFTGIAKTHSFNKYITDSAAGGTAIACGVKTNNGMIGMSSDSIAVPSILSIAGQNGLATGIVVTCNLTHATPASFYAHAVSRKLTEDIALDLLAEDVNVLIGGGLKEFENRSDGRNLSAEMRDKGYQVVYKLADARNIRSGNVLALLAEHNLPALYTSEGVEEKDADHATGSVGRGDMLPESVELAIDLLNKKNKNGFLLVVEGSQIDFGGHANNQDYVIKETIDFDKAIQKALDFAEKDKNTLVIITADHETGGVAIEKGDYDKKSITLNFTKKSHTAALVPVFSYGTNAGEFSGWYENTDIMKRIKKVCGWK